MSFLKKLFRWSRDSKAPRVRICVECGMPVGDHKGWCSIYRAISERPALARTEK